MQEANRLKRLPLYLFTIIDEFKEKARKKGVDIIDLGMGNPDMPTPKHIIKELIKTSHAAKNHRYSRSTDDSEKELRRAIAKWYKRRFGVKLDPDSEVLPLIGSKEGIAHLSLAFLNNDDIALVPNPAYPVHFNGVLIAGGILHNIPIYEKDGYLPDLWSVPKNIVKKSKLLFLSYPHNPTAAIANIDFFKDVVKWSKGKNIIIGHDLAYSDIVFDTYKAPSILEVKGAKETCIEFHTCSKSYNMAGWRVGFAVGNKDILKTLAKNIKMYKKRRDTLVDGLRKIGWNVPKPKATFYIWARIPDKYSALTSMEFVALLIRETGVAIAPGTGFGEYGEGYVRFALVEDNKRLKEAVRRIKRILEMET